MSNPVYSTSNDHDVKAVVLYAYEGCLYSDSDHTVGASKDLVFELFMKGMLRVYYPDFNAYWIPVSCKYTEPTINNPISSALINFADGSALKSVDEAEGE